MTSTDTEFFHRVSRIPLQGMGLSTDVYSPGLLELMDALDRRCLDFGYMEIFKASQRALTDIRRRRSQLRFQYHAEGIWVTQPGLASNAQFETALMTAAGHLATLDCSWLNHECASKQIAGYSFGTYLPPLFTKAGADLTAENATLIQRRLAASQLFQPGHEPLLLIEIPPLTYFGFGDLPVAEFFRRIVSQTSCGLVLDIGHVWTVYRYSGPWRRHGLREFLDEFLQVFPLERVVQIHMAGLDVRRDAGGKAVEDQGREIVDSGLPLWIDAHGAPIPEVLWQMLAQVLSHPQLINLKGMALEVDTKSIAEIVAEFEQFQSQFGQWFHQKRQDAPGQASDPRDPASSEFTSSEGQEVATEYDHYARIVTNSFDTPSTPSIGLPLLGQENDGLDIYRRQYLPQEILEWGGSVRDMFPETVRELEGRGIPLSTFVEYWFREPRSGDEEYDFFLLKIERVVDFVKEVLPDTVEVVAREADELRAGYHAANEPIGASLHATA